MAYIIGLIAGALAILVSVSLHEAGHMATAKAFGMKVTRYFVGFGPTLWSFKRGETEYGVKGIPLGGFVKIVGMTPQDEDAADPKAMWRYPVWKRTIVMAAGSAVHIIIAFVIFWGVAAFAAMPNPAINFSDPYVQVMNCVPVDGNSRECGAGDHAAPAQSAGLQTGDKIVAINSMPINAYADMVEVIRTLPPGQPAQFTYVRQGEQHVAAVTPVGVERSPVDNINGAKTTVSAIGIANSYDPALPLTVDYNAIEAFPVAGDLMGMVVQGVVTSIQRLPEKVPGLWASITGGERDPEGPVSVVGATRLSGEVVDAEEYPSFWMIVASLNIFVGLFNLLPLLPLDGGHIAIAWFERARSWVYARLRKPDPGRVDYYKLMPLTYMVILIFGAFTLLTVTADIVNPVTIFR